MSLRHRAPWILLFLTVCLAWPLQAKEKPEALLLAFPESVADCKKGDLHDFGDARLGNSIAYDSGDLHITVYAYDLGKETIRKGIADPVIKAAFAQAKKEIKLLVDRGNYAKGDLLEDGTATYGPGKETLRAVFLLKVADKERDLPEFRSEIHVFGIRDQIIKFRISTRPGAGEDAPKAAERFVRELLEAIERLP